MSNEKRQDVYAAIDRERDYQDRKWGGPSRDRRHALPAWMLIMRKELQEAEDAWMKGTDDDVKREILQVVATGVAALESHGVTERDNFLTFA